jgi:hypothetical protein
MSRKSLVAVVPMLMLVARAAAGQHPPAAPELFGTEGGAVTVIGYDDFFPRNSTDGWTGVGNSRSSPGALVAGLNMIPNGAILEAVIVYVYDADPVEDVEVAICSSSWTIINGEGGIADCGLAVGSTSGMDSATVIVLDDDIPIQYQEQVDFIGPTVKHFYLQVEAPGPLTRLHMARLIWRRQVSTPEGAPTFGDVPADHGFYQFVEALARSGITAGCGGGNYCPDAPITRGQMAVFLAKALGLHWPWEAVVKASVTEMR